MPFGSVAGYMSSIYRAK